MQIEKSSMAPIVIYLSTRDTSARSSGCPLDISNIKSWDLDVLAIETDELKDIVLYIFFESELGVHNFDIFVESNTFVKFHDLVRAGYLDLPYHCYQHAANVVHTVHRMLGLNLSRHWLSDLEQYSLLVAAIAHDLGHFGVNNPFLCDTRHELALRYNDQSPLENMHCSNLFRICALEGTDVFGGMTVAAQKDARKVCIATILKTDNAFHFDMVKDINHIYEMVSDICEEQAATKELTLKYQMDVLQKNKLIWLEVFLHFADVSNVLRPFHICHVWAWRVLDEFFAQGDEEKRLGLPVGMLNDRDKVNRPGSQHGFINFLIVPLVTTVVRFFPALQPLHEQMASNFGEFLDIWVTEVDPPPEDLAKKKADVKKVEDMAVQLRQRCALWV